MMLGAGTRVFTVCLRSWTSARSEDDPEYDLRRIGEGINLRLNGVELATGQVVFESGESVKQLT